MLGAIGYVLGACVVLIAGCSGAAEVDLLFDMGPETSPLARGANGVHEQMLYSARRGFGWERRPQAAFNDESGLSEQADAHYPLHLVHPGKDLYRDGFEDDGPIRFRVDVPPGRYLVTVFVGRYAHPRHDLIVRINSKLLAEDVDAWGRVWGSQGGTPVRSIKANVSAEEGSITIEVDYKASTAESWRQYSSVEPEGGRLWFLGKNKSSILGVQIRSAPRWPIVWQGSKLTAVETINPSCQKILKELNSGRIQRAIALFSELPQENSLWYLALRDAIAAHLDTPDSKRVELLESSVKQLGAMKNPCAAVRERLEVARRVLTALKYMRMWGYHWASRQTGLNSYQRYWAAYECCNAVAPDDPVYPLALLIKMRIAYWNGREGGWKHCYRLAREHAQQLSHFAPEHRLVRMYLGQSVRYEYPKQPAPPDAPRWAVLQREAMGQLRRVVHYWVKERQSPNGELGGGWGDDVEILRNWVPLVLAVKDKLACSGARRLADGLYLCKEVEGGYAKQIGDVEHAAEPTSDTQPLMLATFFGEPVYFEHCLETMRCMRDVWTARDRHGQLHFRSHYFSASRVLDTPPRSADVPLNARAAKPGIWVMWYSSHPTVRQLLADWCRAWVWAARSTDRGKPAGIIPGSVSFPDGRIGGYAEHWWQTKGYDDLTAMGYTATLYHMLVACWAETGDEQLLEPIFSALNAIRAYHKAGRKPAPAGSYEWVGQIHDNGTFFDVVEKWRLLSADERFDDLLAQRATAVTYYRLTADVSKLERRLQSIVDALSHNLPMLTTEVLFTDRVSIPGSTLLTNMLTGSAGNPTYYPLHAVTWPGLGEDVAVFVTEATTKTLKVQCYLFDETCRQIRMRLWRLQPGIYELTVRPDATGEQGRSFQIKEKGSYLTVAIAPKCVAELQIVQKAALVQRQSLPDLAVGAGDLKQTSPSTYELTVHNLGTCASPPCVVAVYDKGQLLAEVTLERIEAPLDLVPKYKTVSIKLPAGRTLHPDRIVIDPADRIAELYESNNILDLDAQESGLDH